MTPADLQLAGIVNSGSLLSKLIDKLSPSALVGPAGSANLSSDPYAKDVNSHVAANVQAAMKAENPPYPNYLFDSSYNVGLGTQQGVNNSAYVAADTSGVSDGDPYKKTIKLIKQLQAENNAWSAQQAQKQMDFQLYMSNTAHQRELEDLKAAGLNPVLTATGGNGAAVTSGAMAQADTSGTSAIADIAMPAIQGMQNTALGVSGSSSSGFWNNPYVKRFLGTAASGLAGKLVKALF